MSYLEHALAWAENGYFVFPCVAGEKRPACANGVHDATTDPEQIRRWWAEDPSFNVAVAPARTGCFVVDQDGTLGAETLARLCKDHGLLPTTLTIRTPRGPSHLHYWFAGSCPSTVSKLGPKLDTRGDGGYVLVPPSVVNGVAYEYAGETDEIAQGPLWIPEAIAATSEATHAAADIELDLPENVERAVHLLRRYVDAGDVAVEGSGGDNRTYQVACEMLNLGLSEAKAGDVMLEEWNNDCRPPWEADELRSKVANAASYAQNDLGVWAVGKAEENFRHLTHSSTSDPKRSRFYPRDETEQELRPPPTWLLPNVLPDEGTVMMFGPSGHYKSFLALDIALTLASGIAGWGAEAREPVPVVYIAAEGARGIERLRRPAWKKVRQIAAALPFFTIDTMPLVGRANEVIEMIETVVARGIRPKLLILDTFARSMAGKNENDAKDTGEFIEAIEAIKRRLNCTVLTLHHTGKEEVRGARGSSALAAGLDTTIEVKSDIDRKLAVVTVRKQKDADIPAAPWTFQGEVCDASLVFNQIDSRAYETLSRHDDPFGQVRVRAALRELLAVTVANGVTTQVLATHMCPPLAADSPEDSERAVAAYVKRLGLLSKSRLRAYADGQGRALKWYVPALDEPEIRNERAGSTQL